MFQVSNLGDLDQFIVVTSTITIILFCDIVFIFYLRKFWKFKEHNAFAKRYAHITMIEGLMFIAQSAFYVIRIIIIVYYDGTLISPVFTAIIGFFWMFFRRILYCCLLWRFWMLLFEMSLTQISLNKKWMNIINPKSQTNSWFISHKSTFGNFYFMRKITILLVILIILFDIIPYKFIPVIFELDSDSDWALTVNILNWIWNVTLPLCLLIIFLLLPPIRDNFYVSKEIKYLVILAMFELIFVILYYVARYYDWMQSNDLLLFLLTALYIGDTWIVYIATCWVYNKVKHIIKSNLLVETNMDMHKSNVNAFSGKPSKLSTGLVSINMVSINSNIETLYSQLLNSIKNEQLLQRFVEYILMDYLINEWVAFIEVVQFMQYIVQFMSEHNIPIYIRLNPLYQMVKLPPNIPSSAIFLNTNNNYNADINDVHEQKEAKNDEIEDIESFVLHCKHIAHELYKKYFDFGGPYEMGHVHDSVKAELDQFMQHKDDWFDENTIDLQWILDKMHDSATHICIVLLQSFYRYQHDKLNVQQETL
eukprot:100044_1